MATTGELRIHSIPHMLLPFMIIYLQKYSNTSSSSSLSSILLFSFLQSLFVFCFHRNWVPSRVSSSRSAVFPPARKGFWKSITLFKTSSFACGWEYSEIHQLIWGCCVSQTCSLTNRNMCVISSRCSGDVTAGFNVSLPPGSNFTPDSAHR